MLRRTLGRSRAYLRLRDGLIRAGRDNFIVGREDLARRYLSGSGIEIGAMHRPLRVPPGVRVRYVDRRSRDDLARELRVNFEAAKIDPASLAHVDVISEAQDLAGIADASVDFVIANHVLEHVEDPVAALRSLARVTRPGGAVLITLPDPDATFDAPRARTTVEHVLRDHEDGPHVSRRAHYVEWAQLIEGVPPEALEQRVEEFAATDARHHFHVWELSGFLDLLSALELPWQLVHAQLLSEEFAVVLRRL